MHSASQRVGWTTEMITDLKLITQFEKNLRTSRSGLSKQYENTKSCQSFYSGDLMDYRDKVQFKDSGGGKKRAMVQFNKVKPYVNAVKGFMAQNRRKVKYIARIEAEPIRKLFSQYSNALADYVRDNANADQIETQADGDMLVCGYGAVETAMTYGDGYATDDPNGQIVMGRLDPLMIGWDHHARLTNLMDRRYDWYQKTYSLAEALELFDDSDPEDFDPATEDGTGTSDGYEYFPNGGRYNQVKEGGVDWSDEASEMVNVFFYEWYDIETFYRAENPIYNLTNPQAVQLAGMQLDMIAKELGDDQDDLFAFDPRAEILTFNDEIKTKLLEHFGEFIEVFAHKRKVFYKAVISGKCVFSKFRSPCQSGFTIQFKTGDYDSKNKMWTGMVNSMKEPVLYYNKALTELMFIIGSNSKGGVMVEKGAVEDIQAFEQKYAKTDSVVEVSEGALSMGKIKPKKEPFQPTGYEGVVQLCDASINDVVGIDKTFLGSSENRDETGILQKRRIKQVVSSLACYFDSISLFQKEHAKLMLDDLRIYAANNDGAMFRITGEDGKDQFIKISADKLTRQYDVTLQEAPQSQEEKQEYSAILTSVGDKLLAAGDAQSAKAIYSIAIKNMPLDPGDIQQVMQILVPPQQGQQIDPQYVQQLEQQVQALMSDVTQADVKKKLSEIALNTARVNEVGARTTEIAASTHKVMAEASRTQQQAVQAGLENVMLKSGNAQPAQVNI